MDKKGSIFDLFVLLLVVFITLMFFGIFIYIFTIFSGTLNDIDVNLIPSDNTTNIGDMAQNYTTPASSLIGSFRLIVVALFFGMVMLIFVSNFFIKSHPAFFVVYLFFIIGAVILAVVLSNVYVDTIMEVDGIGDTFKSFTIMNFIMQNLPGMIGFIGFMGAIFLFMNINRNESGYSSGGVSI
jgi:hypothetical protein